MSAPYWDTFLQWKRVNLRRLSFFYSLWKIPSMAGKDLIRFCLSLTALGIISLYGNEWCEHSSKFITLRSTKESIIQVWYGMNNEEYYIKKLLRYFHWNLQDRYKVIFYSNWFHVWKKITYSWLGWLIFFYQTIMLSKVV